MLCAWQPNPVGAGMSAGRRIFYYFFAYGMKMEASDEYWLVCGMVFVCLSGGHPGWHRSYGLQLEGVENGE